jgi:hypothetical protein
MRNAKHLAQGTASAVQVDGSVVVAGTAYHLWFLPFILLVTLAAYPVAKGLLRGGGPSWALAGLLAGARVAFCVAPSPVTFDLQAEGAWNWRYALEHGWRAMPAVCWGLAMIPMFPFLRERLRGRWWAAGGCCALATGCALGMVWGGNRPALANLAGVLLLVGAAGLRSEARWMRGLARCGRLAFSLYLVHVAVLRLELMAMGEMAGAHWAVLMGMFVSVVAISAGVSWWATRVKAVRWAMP